MLVAVAALLTIFAATGSLMPGDHAVLSFFNDTPGGSRIEPPAEWLAIWWVERAALSAAALYALWRRSFALAGAAILVVFAAPLNSVFKELIERERPTAADAIIREQVTSFGYPSGHAMSATLFYGYAALASAKLVRGAARTVAVSACLSAAALIGWQRMWAGVHWPSDVAGGFIIGALLVIASIGIALAGGRIAARESTR
jgi:undecaprenyl-diphosphatase